MSNMMKVAGKMMPNGEDYIFIETVMTPGLMSTDGTPGTSANLEYTQRIPVAPGDVVAAVGTADPAVGTTNMRIITCYANGEAVSASGYNPGELFKTPWEIPSGIDEIVMTVQSSYTHYIRIKPAASRAVAIAVAEDGKVLNRHEWEAKTVSVATDYVFSDTSNHSFPASGTPAVDLSGYALVSIRVINTTNVGLTIGINSDLYAADTRWLMDSDGLAIEKKLSAVASTIITADDIPQLNYLQYLRIRVKADSVPESGSMSIVFVLKR